jgi:exopolyphosphatase/guanosine-5'-triphosphate,3'-diphosphate pyrophosphatase
MRVAALDFGSNTFLCLIADIEHDGRVSVIKDLAEVVRLSQDLESSGIICEEAFARARSSIGRFMEVIKLYKPDKVLAVATAAARRAKNREVLLELGRTFGISIKLISGEKEAELTFRGVSSSRLDSTKKTLVIDIGGGSTELILGNGNAIDFKKSFEMGVVKLKEKYVTTFPICEETQFHLRKEIENVLDSSGDFLRGCEAEVLAVAGTPTTLAAAVLGGYDPDKVNGFRFTIEELLAWQTTLLELTPNQIEYKYGVPSGRSDVLAVGVMILVGILAKFGLRGLSVSVRGLRFGLAQEIALADRNTGHNYDKK